MTMFSPFASQWPPWDPARILGEDSDLIVIDKPSGLSTQSSEMFDAISRVRNFLAQRDRVPPDAVYLAVHRPLERDTSGVLIFSRHKRANASLAAQFERGTVRAVYLAAVHISGGAHRTRATRSVSILERSGPRALVEIHPDRPGNDRVRTLLTAIRATLAGDVTAHGPPAHRLMLHLAALTILHPSTRQEVTYRAPLPRELSDWVRGPAHEPLEETCLEYSLARAIDARYPLALDPDTNAFRLANDAGDAVPGVTLDRYGDWALVQFYTPEARAAQHRVLDVVTRLGPRGVYAKFRPRQANILVDTRRPDLAPSQALRGDNAPFEFPIREHGLQYLVRLGDGLSTGIFLDQRENRRRVREMSSGRTVLNLFAYTCAFTVAAAAGNAAHTVSVDVSSSALAWGQRNLSINELMDNRHLFVVADVFGWLEGARVRGDRFHLVILDPPSYSTTKDGTRFSAISDYRSLATRVYPVLAPGGALLACTNHRGIARAKLRRFLHEAAREAHRTIRQMRDMPDPMDFPPLPGHEPHLKSVLVTVA